MRKNFNIRLTVLSFIFLLITFFSFASNYAYADSTIYLGGMSAGFSLNTKGAEIIGVCDVITDNGLYSPCRDAEICVGDIITSINDNEINNVSDIEKAIKNQTNVIIIIERDNESLAKTVKPAKDINGTYKLGVFIRDAVNGIGTITFIKNNRFASLGHPVLNDKGELLKISGGSLYNCSITGCVKGERGKAGELRGVFAKSNSIATIDKNLISGVYGEINSSFDKSGLIKTEIGEAVPGCASILSTISGGKPKEYEILIIKADSFGGDKNFVIKITDKDLLDSTGGIVQGMSGSPILQNGKLVGAVTHVFINDPTRGFGIGINNMVNN